MFHHSLLASLFLPKCFQVNSMFLVLYPEELVCSHLPKTAPLILMIMACYYLILLYVFRLWAKILVILSIEALYLLMKAYKFFTENHRILIGKKILQNVTQLSYFFPKSVIEACDCEQRYTTINVSTFKQWGNWVINFVSYQM